MITMDDCMAFCESFPDHSELEHLAVPELCKLHAELTITANQNSDEEGLTTV